MVGDSELSRWTGTGSGKQTVNLTQPTGQEVRLRFEFQSDSSVQMQGFEFWNFTVKDSQGKVILADDGGRRNADALLELACDVRLPVESRSRAIEGLARTPPEVATRVLGFLSEHPEISSERAVRLIDRLPSLVLGTSLEELLTEGPGLSERDEAVLVGGVRVRKR